MRRNAHNPARTAMKWICTLLGVIFGIMLSVTLYVQVQTGQLSQAAAPVLSLLNQSGQFPLKSGTDDWAAGGGQSKNINILLVGQDKREGEKGNRSDSMILCTFNPSVKKLYMTSFLRDLYVPIPGHGSNRINAAYAFGGAPLLKKTLEHNFAVEIDGCVEVDFGQFAQIIDALGGVTIELRQDETDFINQETGSNLEAGARKLNGEQALAYSRIRKLDGDGDFSRTARQRRVLEEVWKTYRDKGLLSLVKTLGTLLPMLQTDMGKGELLGYAVQVFPYLSQIEIVSQRIPQDGQYAHRNIDGMAVLVADMDAARETMKQTLSAENG